MPSQFDLVITADYPSRTAQFTLRDSVGVQIAYRQTDFKNISVGHQQGLFDLRNFLRLYVEEGKERAAVAEIGVCIAEEVLGEEIFGKLWESTSQRTLRIQLPGAGDTENHLAAALARVPWEIATPRAGAETLSERNLLVRVVHDMKASASTPIELAADEPLRVLFVFAEARGSMPLGARRERQDLLRLFEKEIYPQRRVVAHFLTHGVTRERLAAQIQENNGYHVVHWSGHGHRNLLELSKPGGASDHLSGRELLDLFNDAGGFLPRLFFLSACHSGDILRVKDWSDFLAVAQGKELGTKEADTRELNLKEQPGYTGTAHALLQGGVPSVIAMRYAVGDDYAREVAVEFYRALLAHAQPKNVAAALTLARQAMLDGQKHELARFAVCDHATPVLYGEEQPDLTLVKGRSPDLNPRNPRLHQIAELTTGQHEHFVGRTWQLAELGTNFIGAKAGAEVKTMAVITGLGGMGKTALVAEALALWELRFEWVLLYQAKPNRLEFDATLRDIHMRLMGELGRYHDHVRVRPANAIYRDATSDFTGPARTERLTRNLLRALQDEPILLVLDNLESNLKPADSTATHASCQDPAWDECLARMAVELVGSPSRVLITCRRPIAALKNGAAHSLLLGPLPAAEAALYMKEHPALSRMIFGRQGQERPLAMRLLNASRFHPLLMDRLAKLAADAALRGQLLAALEALEKTKDFAQLPALFATKPGDAKELAYLDDALVSSLDQLIADASPDGRRLLWMIALANEPVELGLLERVWSGEENEQTRQFQQIKEMLETLPTLPPELQEELKAMQPEFRAMLDALPPPAPTRPDPAALLHYLLAVGLLTEERAAPDDTNVALSCHELIRERSRARMEAHPQERGELTENSIRLAYAEKLEMAFNALRRQDMTAAFQAGSRALVYCAQAEAWDRLAGFASGVVNSTEDPRQVETLIPWLQMAVDFTPDVKAQQVCLLHLADALRGIGRPDASIPFYYSAVVLASASAEAANGDSEQNYGLLATTLNNWAIALTACGELSKARSRLLEAAEAYSKAGRPAIHIIGAEIEAYRISIMCGDIQTALPKLANRLAQMEGWWQRHQAGEFVKEAPDLEGLARRLIGALNVASNAYNAVGEFESALSCLERDIQIRRSLRVEKAAIAQARLDRAVVLVRLDRIGEAKAEMEDCILLFDTNPYWKALALSSLATVFYHQSDIRQAIEQETRALAIREQLPGLEGRAISHINLSTYLQADRGASALERSGYHFVAGLLYSLLGRLDNPIRVSMQNYASYVNLGESTGAGIVVPRLVQLLADPAFAPLEQWLRQRQEDLAELQAGLDKLLEHALRSAHQAATEPQS